jgi:chemotaxis protein methyltransferase CheR
MTTPSSSRLIGVIREAYGLDLGGMRMTALYDCLGALDQDVEKAADEVLRSPTRLGELVECATNNETYFFRHVEQLEALRALVAEDLHENPRPSLRVWVAGCSSGEEPLSIAAILRDTLLGTPGTTLSVLGTDLHRGMLRKAGKTEYTKWSFRGVSAEMRASHFVEQEGRYRPNTALRSLVTYRRHNLFEGPPEAIPFDVVSCRNVLIYFDNAMVKRAMQLLSLAVAPGGLLLLGPAESPTVSLPDFEMVFQGGVALFRRKTAPTIAPPPREASHGSHASRAGHRSQQRQRSLAARRPRPTPALAAAAPPPRPVARADVLGVEAQVAGALAALERGETDAARERLRAVIAVDQESAMAHYLVGSILESRGERDGAEHFYQQALAALADLDPSRAVPYGGGITVDELAHFLAGVLQSHGASGVT